MRYLLSRSALAALLASTTALAGATTALAADVKSSPSPRGESIGSTCDRSLEDSLGFDWQLEEDGYFSELEDEDGDVEGFDGDAIDDAYYLDIDGDGDGSFTYYQQNVCENDENDREVVYAPQDVEGVEVTRKLYVPGSGLAFGRTLNIIRNPTDAPVTIDIRSVGDYGADSDTTITESSDGDETAEVGDRWVTVAEDAEDQSDTEMASFWDGGGAPDAFDEFDTDDYDGAPGTDEGDGYTNDYYGIIYRDVVIPAGGTVTYMHVEHGNEGTENVVAFAEANNESPEFFAQMSNDELRSLRNWSADRDDDTVLDADDNCIAAANGDQADMDGDGEGDACDDDIDGDGLTNVQEERLGMNPRNANSDGDALNDGFDRCPTRAGTQSDGCPEGTTTQVVQANQTLTVPVRRLRARRLTADVSRKSGDDRLRVRTRGRLLLPAGMTALEGCKGQVLVTVKAGKRTVSTRRAELADDCTYRSQVTFKDLSRLGNRNLNVQATFQGNSRLFRQRAKKDYIGRA